MINLTADEIRFIKENFENAEELIASNDLRDVLYAIDGIITYKGFDINEDLNDFGREAQRIYDDIYYNNK